MFLLYWGLKITLQHLHIRCAQHEKLHICVKIQIKRNTFIPRLIFFLVRMSERAILACSFSCFCDRTVLQIFFSQSVFIWLIQRHGFQFMHCAYCCLPYVGKNLANRKPIQMLQTFRFWMKAGTRNTPNV